MKTKLLGLISLVVLLGLSPASADTFDYTVNFDIGALSIIGNIVLGCDNCVLDPNGFIDAWSFSTSDGVSISSSDPGSYILANPIYPLTATPHAINFDAAGPPGIIQFSDSAGYLLFQSAYVDAPSEILFSPCNELPCSIIYAINDFTGNPPSAVPIAQISPPVGVPTPIAGAGLPGMVTVLAGVGFVWWRRKRNPFAALVVARG
jgi:hypothetical protein